ncbi:AMP-binding protein [Bordetella genomosp. 13]|uniref:AMP-binding protein n=1 Tax=Bordetella genomosp. 13 TaxID=463040 RepID=UPI001C92E5ED|nr:AMP-binding protein [Bordetella genomosp. 13]
MIGMATPDLSLPCLLETAMRRDPDATAAIDAGMGEIEGIRVSYGQLWRRVLNLRHALAERGLGQGDCVGVWLPNWSDSLVWQFAAASLGAHVIGINTRYNVEEVVHVLNHARPRVLAIAHGFARLDLDERLRRATALSTAPAPSVAVVAGPHGVRPHAEVLHDYDVGGGAWIADAPVEPGLVATRPPGTALRDACAPATALGAEEGRPDAPAAMHHPDALVVAFTTSGSTGRPKLAAHTARAVVQHARAVAERGDWRPGDVTLCALPLTGVFSFVPAVTALATGGACLLQPTFDPDAIVQDMARFGVTHVVGADDIVGRLAQAWQARRPGLPRWRRLFIADFNGASQTLAQWAEHTFGVVACGVYGSSEVFALAAFWSESVAAPRRWGGGGMPVSPGIDVRCVDPDTGQVMEAGACGELRFRGYNVVDAYLGAPDLRVLQWDDEGWFRTGDLGVVHADGAFEYVCRAGDVLRLKGFLVEPAEIEQRLAAHDAVDVAKVVGIQLADGQTEAVAFVTLRQGASVRPDALAAWCADRLARYKVPRSVHVLDAMPTTSGVNGIKIRNAELRDLARRLARLDVPPRPAR